MRDGTTPDPFAASDWRAFRRAMVARWPAEPGGSRAERCVAWLLARGLLTQGECIAVDARLYAKLGVHDDGLAR